MAQHPVTQLRAESFGPFERVDIDLAPGVNVIVGDNATGKSQLLKLLYASTATLVQSDHLTKAELQRRLASKLEGVFRPASLGRLARRLRGRTSADLSVKFAGIGEPLSYNFSSQSRTEVTVDSIPNRKLDDTPVFLPSHELLSLGASFTALYDTRVTPFEETWRDTVALLQRPALRGPRAANAAEVMQPFSALLDGGTVVEKDGQFFLSQPGVGNLEASLLAEGHRKLAMVMRLVANGVLLQGGYLFWDEPEANLNPRSQKAVTHALLTLAAQGSQVFVTTHSMYLLREMAMSDMEVPIRYVGLRRDGEHDSTTAPVVAETVDALDDLGMFAALAAEAEQSDRYLTW
ncbi:AAA family ATPase [Kytococcus sp. Marseille-QA3725]